MPDYSKRYTPEFKRKAVELCKSKGDDMRSRRQGARVRPGVALRPGQDRGRLRMRARRQPVPDGRGPQASEARERAAQTGERDTFNSKRLLRQPSAAAATPKEAKFAFVLMFKGSWPVSEMRDAELADDALGTAIARHRPAEGCVHRSDHGTQYVSVPVSKKMRGNGIKLSMGAVRSPWDNAAMKSPMGAVESEGVHARVYDKPGTGRARPARVHRARLQQGEDPLRAGLREPGRLREGQLVGRREEPPDGGIEPVNENEADSDSLRLGEQGPIEPPVGRREPALPDALSGQSL